MGSSSKKRLEKKKDFHKPKLKVGKAKPKAANQTDTSFRSAAIVLNQQSIRTEAPDFSNQFQRHLSLLSSRSENQRKESLAYLSSGLSQKSMTASLPVTTAALLEKSCPLILDGSLGVRQQLQKLLQSLPPNEVRDRITQILPYIRAAITHLSSEIRRSALDTLSWLLKVAGDDLVSCPGGWPKTLESIVTLLGWKNLTDSVHWNSSKASFRNDAKATARVIQVLDQMITVGLVESSGMLSTEENIAFPLWDFVHHQIPTKSNAFAYLNLFDAPLDDDTRVLEDREERLQLYNNRFRQSIATGVDAAKKEGGDIGRAAGQLAKVLEKVSTED